MSATAVHERLAAEINAKIDAINGNAIALGALPERRNYAAMSPEAAAAEYAYDEGAAEARAETLEAIRKEVRDALRADIDENGRKNLTDAERKAIDNDDKTVNLRLAIGDSALDVEFGVYCSLRAKLVDRAAEIVADVRVAA